MKKIASTEAMRQFGATIGASLRGGEMIELIGDVGAGKTTLTKGIGIGLQVDDDVQSPSFTISREYPARDGLELHHYDFYRLSNPGIVTYELAESIANPKAVTVVEWGESARGVLPPDRIIMTLQYEPEDESRNVTLSIPDSLQYISEVIT